MIPSIVMLLVMLLFVPAWAIGPVITKQCRMTWKPPVSNIDGSPLQDLDTYRIYVTQEQGVYDWERPTGIVAAKHTRFICPGRLMRMDGQHYAVVRAVDTAGNVGATSNEFAFVIHREPAVDARDAEAAGVTTHGSSHDAWTLGW